MIEALFYTTGEKYKIAGRGWSYPVKELWKGRMPEPGDILCTLGYSDGKAVKRGLIVDGFETGNGNMVFAFLFAKEVDLPAYTHVVYERRFS
jgi:hypothetical protein